MLSARCSTTIAVLVLCLIFATHVYGQAMIQGPEGLPYGRPNNRLSQDPSGDIRPVPDPTALTSQQLFRELGALRAIIETRLDGMDKALEVFQKDRDKSRADIEGRLQSVRELLSERFKGIELQFEGIQLQFKERDTRVEQTARDSKTAVDAALQAAKEAVEKQNAASSQAAQKSEGAFTKQIDQLAELFRNGTKSLEDKITIANKVNDDKQSAINDRITRIEAIALGARTAKGDSSDSTLMIVAVIGALVGVAGVVIAVLGATRNKIP